MRTAFVPYELFWLVGWTLLSLSIHDQVNGQTHLSDQVDYMVHPVCADASSNRPANINQYFIQIDILSIPDAEEDFNILLSDLSIVQFHVNDVDIPYTQVIGPFNHSGIGNTFRPFSLQSLDTGAKDDLLIPEVLCGYFTNNGLNQAGYFCEALDGAVIAQAAPPATISSISPDQLYIYVLKDINNLVIAKNYTGLFRDVDELSKYSIHAYAVAFHEMQDFYNQIVIGNPISINSDIECYAFCGMFDLGVRCQGFDLSLSKDLIGGPSFLLGDTVRYNITVRNEGIYTAYNVVVIDDLPAEVNFIPSINPDWGTDLKSIPIDSILPGDSIIIPIAMIIDGAALSIEIVNRAEIFFAGETKTSTISAFDADSTPGNDNMNEDDIDEADFSIIENFCAANFEVEVVMETICKNAAIKIYPIILKGSMPANYIWIKIDNGIRRNVRQDSILYIENPTDSDFGSYELEVVDDDQMCSSTFAFEVTPVTEDRTSCINDINLSLSEDCSLRIDPRMLTLNDIPSIDQFIIKVVDHKGQEVDLDDLSGVSDEYPLEASLINPCTNQAVCWSFIHLEYKHPLNFDYYKDTIDTYCIELANANADQVISSFNKLSYRDTLLDADDFELRANQKTCLIGWDISIHDVLLSSSAGLCSDQLYGRIYTANNGSRSIALDTAIIAIRKLPIDSILFPKDLSNLSCSQSRSPADLSSIPLVVIGSDTIPIEYAISSGNRTLTCNIAITYSDQIRGNGCAFEVDKVVRQWSSINWCDKEVKIDLQYLYFIDNVPPILDLTQDTIEVSLSNFACAGDIDLKGFVEISDNCDPNPSLVINRFVNEGPFIQNVPTGIHDITINAVDRCGNSVSKSMTLIVKEFTPPIAVIAEFISFSYSGNSSNWISATSFDQGSHDSGCGPVTLSIAWTEEVNNFDELNAVPIYSLENSCGEALENLDRNNDKLISRDEIFRDRLLICCEDIDKRRMVIFKVTDQFGNTSEVMAQVNVQSKIAPIPCDDQDPCTYDDVIRDGCPCQGKPDDRDLDVDGLVDCIDDEFIFCLGDISLSLTRDEVESAIANGATPGPCAVGINQATIAGRIYTRTGQNIEDVAVFKGATIDTTSVEGAYAFPSNTMYERYEMWPEKNDDPLNGLSALDLLLIQQNLLGMNILVDPYDMIAADINGDGKLSAADLADLRKLLLGQVDTMRNNKSWRFIPVKTGINVSNPYEFDERIIIPSLEGDSLHEDWIGIKIGDISGDAVANSLEKARSRKNALYEIYTYDQVLTKGQEVTIPLFSNTNQSLSALQMGVRSDFALFNGFESGWMDVRSVDFSISEDYAELNIVKIADRSPLSSKPMFSLIVTSQYDGMLSDVFNLNGGFVKDMVYDIQKRQSDITLRYTEETAYDADRNYLHQNRPNPFSDETFIKFKLAVGKQVTFNFYAPNGQILFSTSQEYTSGEHSLRVTNTQLGQVRGLVYYQMEAGDYKSTRSMIAGMK